MSCRCFRGMIFSCTNAIPIAYRTEGPGSRDLKVRSKRSAVCQLLQYDCSCQGAHGRSNIGTAFRMSAMKFVGDGYAATVFDFC